MEQKTREDYLRALFEIYEGQKDKKSGIKSVDLAKRLGVSKPAASEVLKKLAEAGYLSAEPYSPIFLTHKGIREGRKRLHAHRVIEVFLAKVLKYSPKRVEDETHELEHAFSEESVEKLDEFLEHPKECPHGKAIYKSMNQLKAVKTAEISLDKLKPGQKCKVIALKNSGPVHRRLLDMGLVNGVNVEVVRVAPLGDPIEIEVKGYKLSLRKEEAKNVIVRVL